MDKFKLIPIISGVYKCGKYIVRRSAGGGKAGRGRNKTASLQITEKTPGGYTMLKMFRYTVGDKKSYDSAEKKCIEWIKKEQSKYRLCTFCGGTGTKTYDHYYDEKCPKCKGRGTVKDTK